MKKEIKVGIAGFGYMGKMHALCYENIRYYYNTDAEVTLYAVVTSKKPDELPVKFRKYYNTLEEMLQDEEVDIVDICGPNYMHAEALKLAIQYKKHIYCEKPLAIDLASAEQVIRYAKETQYQGISRVTFEYRFVPAIMRAKQLIEEGRIGSIINFNVKYYGSEFIDPARPISWQSTKSLSGGGVLYAMGTHALDLIRYLVGDVEEVFAQKKTHFKKRPLKENPSEMKPVEIEDIINVQLLCHDEIMGNLLLSQVAAGSGVDFSFEIYGEKGTIKFDHTNANVISFFSNEDAKEPMGGLGGFKQIETTQKYGGEAIFPPPRVTIDWIRYHVASVYDLIHAVSTGTPTHPDIYDGYEVQRLTDAIYQSADTHQIVKL